MKRWVAVCACLLAGAAFAAEQGRLTREYFGMHIHRADAGTAWPSVPFGAWRLWDAEVTWKDLEPRAGHWEFSRLDRYVAMAALTHTELLLPLALTPRWASSRPDEASAYGPGHAAPPRDPGSWLTYVETVATRYRGRVAAYEVWNEPNAAGFFSGDEQAMVRLACAAHDAIKRIDPAALVVSPAATHGTKGVAWLEAFIAAGGSRCFDVIGFHFYTQAHEPPEAMIDLVNQLHDVLARRGVADRPIWNTEAGWYIRNARRPLTVRWQALDADTAVAYVGRALLLGRSLGMERFYWYAWDNGNLGLLDPDDGSLKPAALAFASVARWMTGATAPTCRNTSPTLTLCEFSRDERLLRVLWSRVGTVHFTPPAAWNIASIEGLLESRRKVMPGERLRIGAAPVLLEGRP